MLTDSLVIEADRIRSHALTIIFGISGLPSTARAQITICNALSIKIYRALALRIRATVPAAPYGHRFCAGRTCHRAALHSEAQGRQGAACSVHRLIRSLICRCVVSNHPLLVGECTECGAAQAVVESLICIVSGVRPEVICVSGKRRPIEARCRLTCCAKIVDSLRPARGAADRIRPNEDRSILANHVHRSREMILAERRGYAHAHFLLSRNYLRHLNCRVRDRFFIFEIFN